MSEIKRRANEARELQSSTAFHSIIAEIKDAAVSLFVDPNSSIDTISLAHERVRATEIILNAIQARLDAEVFEDNQKARDRG